MATPLPAEAPTVDSEPARPDRSRPPWASSPWLPVGVAVAVKLVLNALVSTRYGWHIDELYYADTGRHLDWGYIDFPSVTPVLAAAARTVLGDSLPALRLVASLAGAATLVVVALLVRRLGGGRNAQVVAMLATFPVVLGANAMFQTVSFVLHAAGAVSIAERWAHRSGGRRVLPWVIGVSTALSLPLIVPALPTSTMVSSGVAEVRDDYTAQLGGPDLAAQVDDAWVGLTRAERSRTVVLTDDYGSAGAVRRFGRGDRGEAPPVVSAGLTNRYWPAPPEARDADAVLAIGVDQHWLARRCTEVRRIAVVANRWNVENDLAGSPIVWCELREGLTVTEARDDLAG